MGRPNTPRALEKQGLGLKNVRHIDHDDDDDDDDDDNGGDD
jgi:hypothetical protein